MNIIQRPATEISATSNYQSVFPYYTQAASTSILEDIIRLVQLLLALLLLGVASVLWFWTISFQTGRQFRHWFDSEDRSLPEVIYKLGEIFLFPIVALANWSRRAVKKIWGIELKLISESKPPQRCSDLFKSNTSEGSASA